MALESDWKRNAVVMKKGNRVWREVGEGVFRVGDGLGGLRKGTNAILRLWK